LVLILVGFLLAHYQKNLIDRDSDLFKVCLALHSYIVGQAGHKDRTIAYYHNYALTNMFENSHKYTNV
jgi:hypothetical protein